MGCGASSAVQAADIPTPLPSFEGKAAPSVGTGASPASTPPSSAESDGEEAGALPLPPGATAADPGEPVVTTSWTDDGAASPEHREAADAPAPDLTSLFDAAREGRADPILEYAQAENCDLDVRDSDGNTLLHWAVLTAKPTLASALVDHGVDVNALNHRGVTALYYASMLGDGGLCTLLVNQGARVNLHSMGSDGPGEHAVLQRKDLIDVELEDEIGLVCTPVQAATVQGHFRVVLFLVQKGADVNIPAHGGNTALHYACMKSYVGLASFLVESGAALDARNDEGKVPADVAEDGMKDLLLEAKSPAAAAAEQDEGSDSASQTKKKLQFNDEDDIKLIDKVGGADCGEEWYKDGPGPHVFGKAFYDSFGASEWKTRVAALKVLIRDMALVQGDPALLYQSACAVLSQAFNDKVAQVYLMSLELLRKVISVFSQKVSQSQLVEPMHGLMATVIPFTGKSQEKVRNESFKAVLFVARQPAIGPALVADLVLNQKKKENAKKWRPLYGRLKILAQMVFEFKFSETNGLSIGAIMEFAAPAFEHPNEQVRKAAVDLFVESYMLEGAAADGYIATLKPALQAMIRDELASIDAPVAPPVAEKPPPTASRLTDDTATSRPVTGAARPKTGAAGADGAEAMPYAAPIKEDGQAASAHIVQFFGDETARCFVGKSWQSRVAALQKIEGKLAEVLDADNEEVKDEPGMADAAYRVVFEALRDPVPHVYTASLALLNALAAAPEGTLAAKDPGAEVLRGRMIRAIVAKLGDRNARIRTRTEQTLLELARLEAPYGVSVVAEHTANPNPDGKEGKEGKPSKATEPQLKLLNTLIQQFSLADEGALSLPSVMALTVPAFEDRDKKVRKVAVAVYVSAWKRVGSEALASYVQHLKPAIRKVLKAKTEGKATSAENAGKDGVEDGGIMFFNADEMKAGGGAGGSGGDGGGEAQAQAGEALPYASSLPADLQEAVKPLAEVFGDDTMQCFYSKQWAPREAALRRVEGQVRMMDGCDRRIFLYVVFMLESALADKIAHVLWGGLSLLRTVVANYAKDLAPVEVQYSLEKLMPKIVTQLGNTNARTSQACEQTCQFLSWKPNVGGAFIARHILSHDHKKNVKSLEVKLVLLAQLVNDFGIGEESISAEDLFAFARPCFEHRSDKVREAAVRVYVAAHKFIGATANDLIGDVKPALRSVLSKAALDDPHTNNERPKTPAAFIFDRPSTAAERLTHSLALGGVGLSAAPILAQAGLASVAGSGEASSGTDAAEGSGEVDAQPVVSEREKALAAEKATDAELNELTGLSGSLDVLKRLFGTDTLLQFRDPDASEREESLEAMQEAIWSNGPLLGSEADVNASFEACCHLVKHALSDKAIAVMCAGLELLKTVIVTHSRKLGAFEFRLALGSLATTILGLSADGPIRVRGKSDEMAVFLAHQPKLGVTFLSRYLLENAAAPDLLKRKDGGRAVVLARLKLLVDLLGEVSAPGGSEQAKVVASLVCKVGGPAGVEALRRLVKQPPTSDAEARERVASELTEVLTEHAGKDHPEAADFTGVLRRSVLAEAAKAGSAVSGPPRGIADPKPCVCASCEGWICRLTAAAAATSARFDAAAEDDANRARSAVAAPRGFDTNEPGALPQLQLSDLRLTCSALCPEEGDARPRTFGGEEGGGHWAPSGGVLGDLPPISLGTPTGSNGLGRYAGAASPGLATSPAPGERSVFAMDPPSPRTPAAMSPPKRSPRAGRRAR